MASEGAEWIRQRPDHEVALRGGGSRECSRGGIGALM